MRFFLFKKKIRFRFGQVKYNTMHPFGRNNESGFQGGHVLDGLISIDLRVINLGTTNHCNWLFVKIVYSFT